MTTTDEKLTDYAIKFEDLRDQFDEFVSHTFDGQPFEIRAFDQSNRARSEVVTTPDEAAAAAQRLQCYGGVYYNLNPASGFTERRTVNAQLIERHSWLLVDIDSERPKGLPADGPEVLAAGKLSEWITAFLAGHHFPKPTVIASGNGIHLKYRIDLPNPGGQELVKAILIRLDQITRADCPELTAICHVDKAVHDPARVVRMPYTQNQKGEEQPGRPHRWAHVCAYGSDTTIPEFILQNFLAATESYAPQKAAPQTPVNSSPQTTFTGPLVERRFLMERYMQHHGIQALSQTDSEGVRRWHITCPFDSSHTGTDAYLFVRDGGAQGFHCSHDSCQHNRWQQFKAKHPPQGDDYDPPKSQPAEITKAELAAVGLDSVFTATVETFAPAFRANADLQRATMPDGTIDPPAIWTPERPVITDLAQREFGGMEASDPAFWNLAEQRIDWLVEDVFAFDQPTIFGAMMKCLKTTCLCDLVVSLITGLPWLGRFPVATTRRVLFVTGEASKAAASRRIRKAAVSKNLGRGDMGGLFIEAMNFPNLPDAADLQALALHVKRRQADVLVLDPLYMGLQGVNTANLNETGPALRGVLEHCPGVSVIFAHHVKKSAQFSDAPNLEDLSQAGIAEFAGNYWLMGRLEEYRHQGQHDIAVRTGGRDEQFAMHRMEFDENAWHFGFSNLSDYEQSKKQAAENDKYSNVKQKALHALWHAPDGRTRNSFDVKVVSKSGRDPIDRIVVDLVDAGLCEEYEAKAGNGRLALHIRPTRKLTDSPKPHWPD